VSQLVALRGDELAALLGRVGAKKYHRKRVLAAIKKKVEEGDDDGVAAAELAERASADAALEAATAAAYAMPGDDGAF
jgi:hypothetical protein